MRYTGPKNRICRVFGLDNLNLFGRKRNPMAHKHTAPGQHGAKRKKKSDFGIQLIEQKKLKAVYGMLSRKQMLRYYHEASQKKKNTPHLFLQRLETRLDNIVYRLKLAPTIIAAQQIVSHGHVTVDGKRVNCRSFEVKPGMVVGIREKSQNIALITDAFANSSRSIPEYLSVGPGHLSGQMLAVPAAEFIQHPLDINMPLICEFFSLVSS